MKKIKLAGISLFSILSLVLLQACSVQEVSKSSAKAGVTVSAHSDEEQIEYKVQALLATMTLEQKVGQMLQPEIRSITPGDVKKYHIGSILNGGGAFPDNNKYASVNDWVSLADEYYFASMSSDKGRTPIPIIWGTDAVHGHNNVVGATLFPHNIGLGAANNPELIQEIGRVTAIEVATTGIDWTFAPTLAVVKDDRWGRTYESYSEEPSIINTYAKSMVNGLQGSHQNAFGPSKILATAKHFIGDGGTGFGDDQGNAVLSQSELFKLHGQGYYSALDANVQTVMVSYSSWNGEKMHGQKHLISDVLKKEMGFDGIVVSDWNGIGQVKGCSNDSCAAAINAGIDLFMVPDFWKSWISNTIEQVNSGIVPMSRIDDAVTRILRVKYRTGLFTAGAPSSRALSGKSELVGNKAHRDIARQAVSESLVLLKNNNSLLPLKLNQHVLVTGQGANNIAMQNGGWTLSWQGTGNTNKDFPGATSIYQGIKTAVTDAGGSTTLSIDGEFEQKPDVAIVVFGEQPYAEYVGDVQNLRTLEVQQNDKKALALLKTLQQQKIPTVAVLLSGRVLWVNKELNAADAFVAAWLPGSEGKGIADVLFQKSNGQVNHDFTGRLSFSWPATPCQTNSNVGDEDYNPLFKYGYGLSYQAAVDTPMFAIDSNSKHGCQLSTTDSKNIAKPLVIDFAKQDWQVFVDDIASNRRSIKYQTSVNTDIKAVTLDNEPGVVKAQFSAKQSSSLSIRQSSSSAAEIPIINLLPYLKDNGVLTWNIRVDSALTGNVKAKIDCGAPCSGEVDITQALKGKKVGEWQALSIDLACYLPSADLRKVVSPLVITSSDALAISIKGGEISGSKNTQSTIHCLDK